jgi:hypothetical protein
MNRTWAKLGGQLGLAFAGLGLLMIALGWNGAASVDFVPGQIPYLLSGGALGLGLIMLGGSFIVVQNSRRDRSLLEAQLSELNDAVTRLSAAVGAAATSGANGESNARIVGAGEVVAGPTSFHRVDCRLVQGKDLAAMTASSAQAAGLKACRICNPADSEPASDEEAFAPPSRSRARARAAT